MASVPGSVPAAFSDAAEFFIPGLAYCLFEGIRLDNRSPVRLMKNNPEFLEPPRQQVLRPGSTTGPAVSEDARQITGG
jgi:hypothetical protein